MSAQELYSVAVTAIIEKDGKYLITRRAPFKKKWPGKWTVPGGKFESSDYLSAPKDAVNAWYNVFETTIRREVSEEVGLEIENIRYLTSIVAEYGADMPHSLIISLLATYKSGDVVLQKEELDKAEWVTVEEAKEYDLIDGIYDELVMAEEQRKGIKREWKKI